MSTRPDVPFLFGGRLSLDLTWTLRFRSVWPTELLTDSQDLSHWLAAVGLPHPAKATSRDVTDARALREAIDRAARASVTDDALHPDDIAYLNAWAAHPPPVPILGTDGSRQVVAPAQNAVHGALSAVARDAIDLLSARDGRLRQCAGPQCALLFYDASRPGTRRWCTTTRCGNKVNTKAYRGRRRSPPDSDGRPGNSVGIGNLGVL